MINVREAKEQEIGVPISIQGVLEEVKKRKTGSGKRGDWSMQNFKIKSGTEFMYGVAWNHEDFSALQGSEVTIVPDNPNKPASGCYIENADATDKQGNPYKNLVVQKDAVISPLGADTQQPDPSPSQPNKTPSKGNSESSRPLSVKAELMKLANLDILCAEVTCYQKNKLKEIGLEMTDEQFQSRWASHYIQGTREGLQQKMSPTEYEFSEAELDYFNKKQEPKKKKETPKPPEPEAPEPEEKEDDVPF